MVTATMTNSQIVTIRGIDLSLAPRAWWRPWILKIGREVQNFIAFLFEQEQDGSGKPLKMNSPQYTLAKIRRGYDPRRGHRTGMLQGRLHGAALFTVGPISPSGEVQIILSDARLMLLSQKGTIGYVRYYIQNKIRGGATLMKLARRFLQQAIAIPLAELNLAVAAKELGVVAPARINPTSGITARRTASIASAARRDQTTARQVARIFGRGFFRIGG